MNWCAIVVWTVAFVLGALHEIFEADEVLIFKKHLMIQRVCRFSFLIALALCLGARFTFERSADALELRFVTDPFITGTIALATFWGAFWAVRAVLWAWSGGKSKEENHTED